ncbi:hypothetical protein FAZ78_25170 [Cereibacter changlensis]|uniref:Recombinase zinc beta ribbon domain-containing protein n=2 Tax=Cereibacter changlensis TaxID=402884 RepID=A0A4U0YNH6_9RHOB|nr:hypothetical protein FAZ78_25170 [Cereibacter changlensis]
MACGCCGGGFAKISKEGFGCSSARNKGSAVCTNMLSIRRTDLEATVLTALEHHLMDPDLVEAFCLAYAEERNRLQAAASAGRSGLEKELAQVTRDHARLVEAIIAGVPADQVKDKMITLDARRKTLETQLSATPADDPLRFHPSMAKTYRDRVATLIRTLGDAEGMEEAKEVVRSLIDRIVLTPAPDGKSLTIDLEGALAGLLALATGRPLQEVRQASDKQKAPGVERGAVDIIGELVLVAGTGFEPVTFRL